jgi:hypothetical protein
MLLGEKDMKTELKKKTKKTSSVEKLQETSVLKENEYKVPGIYPGLIAKWGLNYKGKNILQATRPDGLVVYFDLVDTDLHKALNAIRAYESPEKVVLAVAMVRASQIAENYGEKVGLKNMGLKYLQLMQKSKTLRSPKAQKPRRAKEVR